MRETKDDGGRLNVRLPRAFLKRLKVECAKRGTTLQAAVRAALDAWLREGRKEK